MALDEFLRASLKLEAWDRSTLSECEEIARELEQTLPTSFRFHKVETSLLGDQQHPVALFEWDGLSEGSSHGFFALIPGGEMTLGYDRAHPFVPNAQQRTSWQEETQRTGMFTGTLEEFLDQVMTPLRRVRIEPFLLETLATPLEPLPIFTGQGWNKSSTGVSFEKTQNQLIKEGFRFPSSDEWEC
jgi:hypothetical protein